MVHFSLPPTPPHTHARTHTPLEDGDGQPGKPKSFWIRQCYVEFSPSSSELFERSSFLHFLIPLLKAGAAWAWLVLDPKPAPCNLAYEMTNSVLVSDPRTLLFHERWAISQPSKSVLAGNCCWTRKQWCHVHGGIVISPPYQQTTIEINPEICGAF